MAAVDDDGAAAGPGGGQYPNYDDDEATFASFLQEHTILISSDSNSHENDGEDDDDAALLEPTADGSTRNVRRVPCYPPLLQRIKNRHYYHTASSSGGSANVFVVEVPLAELASWDAVRGGDLAQRAVRNAARYSDLFCRVIDSVLDAMDVTASSSSSDGRPAGGLGGLRDSIDVLHEQRRAQQAARAASRAAGGGGDAAGGGGGPDDVNGPLGGGGLMNDAAVVDGAGRNDNPGGATEDFPPLLMRRYELRVLPLGRGGTYPPFANQQQRGGSSSAAGGVGGGSTGKDSATAEDGAQSDGGVSLRDVRSRSMGRLVTIKGMIVRASDVKPACVVATYTCDACGCEIYQVVQNKREFMPQRLCPSADCMQGPNRNADTLHLQTRGSKFVKFQELKLQELPSQVPMGHVPRSMSVHCRGELTRVASPGDVVTVDGVFLPQRVAESGYRAMKAGLISTTFLEAQNIMVHKKSYDESATSNLSDEEKSKLDEDVMAIATGEDPIGALSASIAPEIFGHEDIKRSLLLQLVGGCTRKLPDGMRIRGDINICLMGDPGVAKSQLLKHVASIAPRGVYTTGKGSSGVGLTAAITKDVTTGEMALEGGALVLADRGICAIDEFDKMDEADRTAIHEVMEQQTVSIAKAGIVATLNARAAVLAAANPLYGRYNRKKSLSENVNLPNSLLSRFDLMFLILDVADVDRDMALARHVTFVHQNEGVRSVEKKGAAAVLEDDGDDDDIDSGDVGDDTHMDTEDSRRPTVSSQILREYIARARRYQPVVPPDVAPYIVEAYVGLRMQGNPGNDGSSTNGDQTVMTARQLLSILRLGQALARLRFSDYVAREDVDEAIRLTHMSKASLLDEYHDAPQQSGRGQGNAQRSSGQGGQRNGGEDATSRIFNIIRDYSTASRSKRIELKLCEAMVLRKGFTAQQLQHCLEEYENLHIIQLNSTGTHIDFI